MMDKAYYVQDETNGKYVAVLHNHTGFYDTNLRSETERQLANKIHGITENQASVAKICSMFDIWDKFNEMVLKLEMIDKAMH
jgi:K+/H+ antiporter YhaU regulatory subunit KhtT